jgi:hypothetical protein
MKVAVGSFCHVHREHWGIESYHRAIKQLCRAERFFVRWKTDIRTHLFCALRAFVHLEIQRWRGEIQSWYALKRHLVDEAVTRFIHRRTRRYSA